MRGLVWLTLAATVVLVGVVTVAPKLVVAEHAEAVVTAGVICVGAGWIAMTPAVVALSRFPDYTAQAGAASVGLRLLITLVAGAAYLSWSRPPRSAFLTALVGWYLALLVVETGVTAYLVQRTNRGRDQKTF